VLPLWGYPDQGKRISSSQVFPRQQKQGLSAAVRAVRFLMYLWRNTGWMGVGQNN